MTHVREYAAHLHGQNVTVKVYPTPTYRGPRWVTSTCRPASSFVVDPQFHEELPLKQEHGAPRKPAAKDVEA